MSRRNHRYNWPWIAAVVFILVAGLTVFTSGQQRGRLADPRDSLHVPILTFGPQEPAEFEGLPDDWSHHHLVFSSPGTEEDAIQKGTYDDWLRIVNDPRYIMQQLKRRSPAQGPAAEYVARMNEMARAEEAATSEELAALRSRDPIQPVRPKPIRLPKVRIHRDWSMDLGSGGKVGAGKFPAKYAFSTTAAGLCSNSSTPDYVVYNSGTPGASGSQANIIAYDNIYSGCSSVSGASTTVPLVYWSYYTGTGTAATSPVLSGDGSKVAFIETPTSGAATLRILKWVGGQGTDYNHPTAPQNLYANTTAGAGTNTAWSTCPSGQSCMISVTFQTELNLDTNSAPFYNYATDTLWVGDNGGYLHEFTGVFSGTPGEVTTDWPVAVDSGHILTSPVYDSVHGYVFVGSNDGYLESVEVSNQTVTKSEQIGDYAGPAGVTVDVADAPLVDSAAGTVYAFVSDHPTNAAPTVYQFLYSFAGGNGGQSHVIGNGLGPDYTTTPIAPTYSGTFDNAYYTSATPSAPTGYLWVCGMANVTPTYPVLYSISISSNTMSNGTTNAYTVSNANTTCSEVTEFYNTSTSTDYIFVSPQTESGTAVEGCTASEGCVISFTDSSGAATLSGSGAFAGGASGMIVDTQNTTVSGTLQLYFGILGSMSCSGTSSAGSGTGGCAVQASQSAP